MAKKTSKTAHVMNLLTKSETSEEVESAQISAQPAVSEDATKPGTDSNVDPISNALEAFVQEEEASLAQDSIPTEETAVAEEDAIVEDNAVKNTAPKTTSNAPTATDDMLVASDGTTHIYINVMEQIVVDIREHYMEKFDLCTCEICTLDVTAFTLNLLPSRYTVTHKGEVFAKLATFSQQYSADIITAITKACIKVKESPRHEMFTNGE